MFELVFDFQGKSIRFMNPLKIITATSAEEVIPCIREIQMHLEKGLFAAGYLSYEAAPAFDLSFSVNQPTNELPLLWFGIYEKHEPTPSKELSEYQVSEWVPSVEQREYNNAIQTIHHAISRGETYQINHTIRLHANFSGDAYHFYRHLTKNQQANYSSYLNLDRYHILSASPELFFQRKGNQIITKPMKGTAPRGDTLEQDEKQTAWLYHSDKNRAENLMIVDLLRNDIGKICEIGSVDVSSLFEIERYPTVFQMTSTIEGTLKPSIQILDIFRALFPCGSITGAPKVQTMKWIQRLEDSPRGVYCGSIGYIEPSGNAIFNVAIRTVVIDTVQHLAEFGVGGGVTWDSTGEDEYGEIITKARLLTEPSHEFDLLETMLLENGKYFLLDYHLSRIKNSALYFDFPLNEINLSEKLEELKQRHPSGSWRVRLLVSKSGTIAVENTPLLKNKLQVNFFQLAERPIHPNRFLYHKTTQRSMYNSLRLKEDRILDTLLWNDKGELTEFTIGNIVVEIEGAKYTPPISSGILPGTFRQYLLENKTIHEKVLFKSDLEMAEQIWMINSVRKWVPMELLK